MSRLYVNPRYRETLAAQGLETVADFLALDGVILWGHPHRSVQRVVLGRGPSAVAAYLKKEHRIRWRERWRNGWAGFGLVSKSIREMTVLQELTAEGIGCPDVIAGGEADGQAFVLVEEVANAANLSSYLHKPLPDRLRRRFFSALGREIARMHDAGFVHPDLYAKHVLVIPQDLSWRFVFIDWQRGWREENSHAGWQTLAKLDASLATDLASPRERLLLLRAYAGSADITAKARWLQTTSRSLQSRRQIQETRQSPLPAGMQHLIRVGNTTLYVTRELPAAWGKNVATWLDEMAAGRQADEIHRQTLPVRPAHAGELVRRRSRSFWDWFDRRVRGKAHTSADFENAAKLFRLQRFGVATPRLLAVGHRLTQTGETVSFLLTDFPTSALTANEWLATNRDPIQHQRVVRAAGRLLRRIHSAGYFFAGSADAFADQLLVNPTGDPTVLWRGVEYLRRRYPLSPLRIRRDLVAARSAFATCSKADGLRFLRAYLGLERLTFSAKKLARSMRPRARKVEVPAWQ